MSLFGLSQRKGLIIKKGFRSLFGLSHRKGLIMKRALWVYLDYHKEKD